jgi:hypothetical protein
MLRSLLATGFVAVSLVAAPCRAWHDVGHMLTTLVAYQLLSPGDSTSESVKRLVAILKKHPRFEEDFGRSMPKGLSEDAQARWLLCRASDWPDQVRAAKPNKAVFPPLPGKQGTYNRSNWHFIDTPLLILANGTSEEQARALAEKARIRLNLSTDVPGNENEVKNILQAIPFNRERFLHGTSAERAVALCWLLHLIGDIHQPLHVSAAFSIRALEPEHHHQGDGGGNAIILADKRNLHAVWDAAPDDSPDPLYDKNEAFDKRYERAYARALTQIGPLLSDADLIAQGERAAKEKDPMKWNCESFELAKEKVYDGNIRYRIISNDQDETHSFRGVFVRLSNDYRKHAHEVGRLRVVQGGYRAAELLKTLLK